MNAIRHWFSNPANAILFGTVAYGIVNAMVASIPAKWARVPIVGLFIRVWARISALTHMDSGGTMKWPGARDEILNAVRPSVSSGASADASSDDRSGTRP
jgi:hypothetical protein